MQTTVTPAFSIPIYSSSFNISDQRKKEIFDVTKMTRILSNDGFISVDRYILNSPEYKDLKDIAESHIKEFLHNILKYNKKYQFYITNSWLMKHLAGDQADKHCHKNSLFSGILYLQCDEDSGEIIFEKNLYHYSTLHQCFEMEVDEYNIFNAETHILAPCQNQIIIFPSMLEHRVTACASAKPRYCIAFNTFVHGELGEHPNHQDLMIKLSL